MADPTADGTSSGATDPPSTQRRPSRLRTIVAALIVVAVFISATVLAAGDDAFQLLDSGPDTCALDAEPDSVIDAAPPSVRQTLSDEPALEWRRVDHPGENAGRVLRIHELSSGLVLVRVNDEGRKRFLTTSNGVDWKELPTPADISPQFVRLAGERWVIAGSEVTASTPATESAATEIDSSFDNDDRWVLDRVATSTDDGATWTEVPIDTQTPPHFREKHLSTLDLMVSEDRIVLVTQVRPEIYLDEVLTNRGLLDDDEDAVGSGFVNGTVGVAIRPRGTLGIARFMDIPLDDLQLTERDLELVNRRERMDPDHLGYVRIYAGDAAGLEIAAEYDSGLAYGTATSDAFLLALYRDQPEGVLYLGSRDGRDWDELYSARARHGHPLPGVTGDGAAWAVFSDDGRREILMTIGCGRAPVPVAAFEPPGPEPRWASRRVVHAGPAGLIAIESHELIELSEVEISRPSSSADDAVDESLEVVEVIEVVATTSRDVWSPDGRTWSLLHLEDAFGLETQPGRVKIAVGRDFVMASVTPSEGDSKWFVAKVP